MVYKKYVYKGGKKHGPYYYHSYREGESVRKVYIGGKKEYKTWSRKEKGGSEKTRRTTHNYFSSVRSVVKNIPKLPSFKFSLPKIENKGWLIAPAIMLVLILGIFIYTQIGFTGRTSLDIQSSYTAGENITGVLRLGVRGGELIPINTKILVEQPGKTSEFTLDQFINANSEGNFYVENTKLSGNGLGYGFSGEEITYPLVFFKLKVMGEGVGEPSDGGESGGEEQPIEEPTDEPVVEDEEVVEPEPSEEPTDLELGEEPTEESSSESGERGGSESSSSDSSSSESGERGGSESSSSEGSAESGGGSSGDGGDSCGEVSGGLLTGGAVSEIEKEIEVDGEVSYENPFSYGLEEGQTAEIIKNSVQIEVQDENNEIKKEKISENLITLQVFEGSLEVTTDYSISRGGFGENYLTDEEEILEINLDELGIIAEQGELKISLVYNDEILVGVTENINIEEPIIENATTEIPDVVANITNVTIPEINITNVTIINETISNLTITNETLGNVSVETTQQQAVIGQPVKWKKEISLDRPEKIKIKLPKEAKNISIKKIKEKDKGDGNDKDEGSDDYEEEEEDITFRTSITGQISAELKLGKEKGFFGKVWDGIKRGVRAITGLVVSEETEEIEITLEENATEYTIEYETEAPQAVEEEIADGKRIIISGPDELHYENVLAYTGLTKEINSGKIRLYHIVNDTRVGVEFIEYDTNNNSLIDYIEWTVPHLSNQTYEIIEITKAEHLDENRTFVSDIYEQVKEKDDNWSEVIEDGEYVRVTFEIPLDNTKDITIYAREGNCSANSENNSIMIDGTEVPCDIYQKKKRIDEIRRLLENER